jgi:hypothetical protein
MKYLVKNKFMQIKRVGQYGLLLLITLLINVMSFANPPVPPSPGGNSGGGSNPDSVPFDSHMNLMFLLAGVAFALITIQQIQKKKKVIA